MKLNSEKTYKGGYKGGYYYYTPKTNVLPEASNPKKTKRGTDGQLYEVVKERHLGIGAIKVQECHGEELSDQFLNGFKLDKNFPKIPWALWESWIQLCFKFCNYKKGKSKSIHPTYEVGVSLLRSLNDSFQTWKIVLSKQSVSSARVDAKLDSCIDIVTGEEYDHFPPDGWVHAGTSHSHNTMSAFFSGTDDDYELTIPGIHIVVGKIDKKESRYELKASVALRGERKDVDPFDVIDFSQSENHVGKNPTFNKKVLSYVSLPHEISYKPKGDKVKIKKNSKKKGKKKKRKEYGELADFSGQMGFWDDSFTTIEDDHRDIIESCVIEKFKESLSDVQIGLLRDSVYDAISDILDYNELEETKIKKEMDSDLPWFENDDIY